MSKFKKYTTSTMPSLSTAALPDIVFMLLFFFMVGAQMVTESFHQFIEIERPVANQLDILKDDHVSYYFIGKAKPGVSTPDGGSYMVLANDKPIAMADIPKYVDEARSEAGMYANDLVAQFTMDKRTTAEYETSVMKQLSAAKQLDISLAGVEGEYKSK